MISSRTWAARLDTDSFGDEYNENFDAVAQLIDTEITPIQNFKKLAENRTLGVLTRSQSANTLQVTFWHLTRGLALR